MSDVEVLGPRPELLPGGCGDVAAAEPAPAPSACLAPDAPAACSDASAPGLAAELAAAEAAELDRRHHLLRHSLPDDVRGEGALVHFEVASVAEAVKAIKKMSQRDLQAKFRAVYGAKTFSNNNNVRAGLLVACAPGGRGHGALLLGSRASRPPPTAHRTPPRPDPAPGSGCAASCLRPSAPTRRRAR